MKLVSTAAQLQQTTARKPNARARYSPLGALSSEFVGSKALNKPLMRPRSVLWPHRSESECAVAFIRSAIRTYLDAQYSPLETLDALTACLLTHSSRLGRTFKGIPSNNYW